MLSACRKSRHAERQTKMGADEEARSRQYKGTAMSDDEVRKVHKILAFGIFAKSYIKIKMPINKVQYAL